MKEIKGIEEVVEESRYLGGWLSKYMQLLYNKRTNTLWYEIFTGNPGNSYLILNDPDDVSLGFISKRKNKIQIENAIERALNGEYYIW
ncbi:hypothetical protein [Enterococcus cecorum]|uniref:hypothetical protein n=1 Tax=Enterococcus cecorum TaxID=44008 RepID=UPI003F239517